MSTSNTQFPLLFEPQKQYLRQDFMVSNCNRNAYKAVEMWPEWPFFSMLIFGPKGCGKTHLAHIFAENVCLKSKKTFGVRILQASDIKTSKVARIHKENPCLIVENVSMKIDEEAFFHLFNVYQNEGGSILFTSEKPFAHLSLRLPDLVSRLKMVPCVPILSPDDDMLEALIIKLFTDRQISVSAEVLNYIIQNMERSFSYAERLVAEADKISLSLKRAVSVPMIKQAMYALSHNTQQELFDGI